MSRSRVQNGVVLIGIIAALVGFAILIRPQLATELGISRPFVIVIGVIAGVLGLRSLQLRRFTERDQADPTDPETPYELPVPGDDFDDTVANLAARRTGRWHGGDFDRIRSRLREVAIAVIRERDRCSRAEANDRIKTGDWTDDPVAQWFLGGPDVSRPPLRIRVQSFFFGDSGFQFYANRTADEITSISPWGAEPEGGHDEDGSQADRETPSWRLDQGRSAETGDTDDQPEQPIEADYEEVVESR